MAVTGRPGRSAPRPRWDTVGPQHGVEGTALTRVAIVGGGPGGLAAALFLGRRGHRVTLFERDGHRPGADLDGDFFDWHRPGVPHAVLPHGLLAPVRTVLRAEAPDVYRAMLRMGARERNELDWFTARPPARPGDEDLVTVQTRRIVLEAALHDAVRREPGVDVRLGEPVEGLLVDGRGTLPRVTGVRTASRTYEAELVLDAGGRRSPVSRWLSEAGCRDAAAENHPVGIAYFCRWYRLRADGPRDPGRVKAGSVSAFAVGGVFPSDNGVFAASLTVSTADPTRAALRDPAVFERAARTFPAIAAWLALEPEAVSGVLAMGACTTAGPRRPMPKGPWSPVSSASGTRWRTPIPRWGRGWPWPCGRRGGWPGTPARPRTRRRSPPSTTAGSREPCARGSTPRSPRTGPTRPNSPTPHGRRRNLPRRPPASGPPSPPARTTTRRSCAHGRRRAISS
ncbi:hypothetical protein GCM10010433_53480 [Streptomyces pulveraceus]